MKMLRTIGVVSLWLMTLSASASASTVDQLLREYQTMGAKSFSADEGKKAWLKETIIEGQSRSCATCHTKDLTQTGKHTKTGKLIDPLAPSVNNKRLTDSAEIEKWFKRNCNWTFGRVCTAQEKGDFLSYIQKQ